MDLFHDVVFEHVYPDVHSSSVISREWGNGILVMAVMGGNSIAKMLIAPVNQSLHRLLMAPSMEEFVKWVFAEDQAISGGVTGKFILKVSGCSRPELNGVYVKQPECYYRRPIFHCIENEKYLFYHGKRLSVSKGYIFVFSVLHIGLFRSVS